MISYPQSLSWEVMWEAPRSQQQWLRRAAPATAMTARAWMLFAAHPGTALAEPFSAECIGCAARAQDPPGTRVLDTTPEMMGAWLGSMISLLDPGVIADRRAAVCAVAADHARAHHQSVRR